MFGLGITGFAKGVAKAQLRSYLAYRSKYPDLRPKELYLATLKTRGVHSEALILDWIEKSKNFQDVVVAMTHYELLMRIDASYKDYGVINETVRKVIPANL